VGSATTLSCAEALKSWLTFSTPNRGLMSELANAALAADMARESELSLASEMRSTPRCLVHPEVRLSRPGISARGSLMAEATWLSLRCETPCCCLALACRGKLLLDRLAPERPPRGVALPCTPRSARQLTRSEDRAWLEHLRAQDDVLHTPRGASLAATLLLRRGAAGAGAGRAWPIRQPLLVCRARHACPGVADYKALLRRRVRSAPLLFPASTYPILPWASDSPPRSSSGRSSRHPGSGEPRLLTPKCLVSVDGSNDPSRGWPRCRQAGLLAPPESVRPGSRRSCQVPHPRVPCSTRSC
jgi:hypothetical protein